MNLVKFLLLLVFYIGLTHAQVRKRPDTEQQRQAEIIKSYLDFDKDHGHGRINTWVNPDLSKEHWRREVIKPDPYLYKGLDFDRATYVKRRATHSRLGKWADLVPASAPANAPARMAVDKGVLYKEQGLGGRKFGQYVKRHAKFIPASAPAEAPAEEMMAMDKIFPEAMLDDVTIP